MTSDTLLGFVIGCFTRPGIKALFVSSPWPLSRSFENLGKVF